MDPLHINTLITFDFADLEYALNHTKELKQWLLEIAANERAEVGLLEYIFCTDDYLLEINKKYLEHDYYTDIITFPLQTDPLEGTLYISIERVKENAVLYKTTMPKELHRVLAHGLLHLLGYRDKTEDEQKEMRSKEEYYLGQRAFV